MDIKQVAKMAKAIMLEHGSHSPIVVVEGADGGFCGLMRDFPADHDARVREMASAGRHFGQRQGRIGRLRQVFLIAEGWMSMAREGKIPDIPPSKDPNRQEVLLVTGLDVEKDEPSFVVLEVARDGDGKVAELKEFDQGMKGMTVRSELLPAFVAGFEAEKVARAEC